MAYELDIKLEQHVLFIRAVGERTRDTVASIGKDIIDACMKNQVDTVLIDVRELEGKLKIFESFSLIIRDFPKIRKTGVIKKAAIVELKRRRERYKFFETAARNRGYKLRIFEKIEPAIEWLRVGVYQAT